MIYESLNSKKMQEKINSLIAIWKSFLKNVIKTYEVEIKKIKEDYINDLENKKLDDLFYINMIGLTEVFERTNMRKDYYKRYHQIDMSNFKEIGAIAFWIVKLKPFSIKETSFIEFLSLRINEEFALYFIFNTLSNYAKKCNKSFTLKCINKELYDELLYNIQFREIPKDAFGCIVELIYIACAKDKPNVI